MKKNWIIVAIAAVLPVFSSCETKDGDSGDSLELTADPKWITTDFLAGDCQVQISTNGEWEAFAYNPWCTVEPAKGSGDGTITVSLEGSGSEAARNTTVEVVAKLGGQSKRLLIDVLQSASEPLLSVNTSEKSVGFESQIIEMVVTTNLPKWSIHLPAWCEAVDPLTYTNEDGLVKDYVVKFKIKENTSKTTREGIVRIFGLKTPTDVNLKQAPVEYFYLEEGAGTKSFDFTGSWTASSSEDWLSAPASGSGAVTLAYTANTSKYPRKSILTITKGGDEKRIVVAQEPHLTPNREQSWTDAQGNAHASIPADKKFWNTGEVLEYKKATKGKGVNIVLFNDAFNKMELAVGGVYETSAAEMADLFLSMPVVRDYKEYFNIYILMKVWGKSGLYNQYAGNTYRAPYDGRENTFLSQITAMPQLKNVPATQVTGTYVANGMAGGYMITFSNGLPYAVFSFGAEGNCPYWLIHEFMGHAFTSLGDMYLADRDLSKWDGIFLKSDQPINSKSEDKMGNDWAPNCRLAEWNQEAWDKFIALPGNEKYADNMDSEYRRPLPEGYKEKHPNYTGGDYMWRVDYDADFMNTHVMSSSGWSRFLVYRRIMNWAGEEYSLIDFFANDQQYANCKDWYGLLGLHAWTPSYIYDPHQDGGSPYAPWDE